MKSEDLIRKEYLKNAKIDFITAIENKEKIISSKFIEKLGVYEYTPFDNNKDDNTPDFIYYETRKITLYFLRMHDFLLEFKKFIFGIDEYYEVVDITNTINFIKSRFPKEELERYIKEENVITKTVNNEVRYFKKSKIIKERWFHIKLFLDKWKDELYELNNMDIGRTYRVHIFKDDIKKILNKAKAQIGYKVSDLKYPTDTILLYLFEDQYIEYYRGHIPKFIWDIYAELEDSLKYLTYDKMVEIHESSGIYIYEPLTFK